MKYKKRVAIIYKSVPQYRRRFYELLHERLGEQGIEFVLVYGQPGVQDAKKRDSSDVPFGYRINNKIFHLAGLEFYWQPCLKLVKGTDLVIVEQASKLLINYILFAQHFVGKRDLALWGHGRNFQEHHASSIGEFLKRFVSTRVHWWFAYNQTSADVVKGLGYPEERITSVQNAIDTRDLIVARNALSPTELDQVRTSIGIKTPNVGLFVGGMYSDKRLFFLIDASIRIRNNVPDFEMIFVGAGPDDDIVRSAAEKYPWIHYVGPKFDHEKVAYFELSKILLMPGAVGLAILDAFSLVTPLVTTSDPSHGPEIEYLIPGTNGLVVSPPDDPNAYANAVIELLMDDEKLERLRAGCREARDKYTIEEMVERFSQGILAALNHR